MNEIVFLIEDDVDGGCIARALGESIFTQADDIDNLKEMLRDAVRCHFQMNRLVLSSAIVTLCDIATHADLSRDELLEVLFS